MHSIITVQNFEGLNFHSRDNMKVFCRTIVMKLCLDSHSQPLMKNSRAKFCNCSSNLKKSKNIPLEYFALHGDSKKGKLMISFHVLPCDDDDKDDI